MNDQEINIAIALACGLQQVCIRCENEQAIALDKCVECGASMLSKRTTPDYCHDLNAMREVESSLDGSSRQETQGANSSGATGPDSRTTSTTKCWRRTRISQFLLA